MIAFAVLFVVSQVACVFLFEVLCT